MLPADVTYKTAKTQSYKSIPTWVPVYLGCARGRLPIPGHRPQSSPGWVGGS